MYRMKVVGGVWRKRQGENRFRGEKRRAILATICFVLFRQENCAYTYRPRLARFANPCPGGGVGAAPVGVATGTDGAGTVYVVVVTVEVVPAAGTFISGSAVTIVAAAMGGTSSLPSIIVWKGGEGKIADWWNGKVRQHRDGVHGKKNGNDEQIRWIGRSDQSVVVRSCRCQAFSRIGSDSRLLRIQRIHCPP